MRSRERISYRNYIDIPKHTIHTLLRGEFVPLFKKVKYWNMQPEGIEIYYKGNPFNLKKTKNLKIIRDTLHETI